MPCDHRTLPSVHVPRSDSAWACFSLMDPCGRVRKGSARAGLDEANLGEGRGRAVLGADEGDLDVVGGAGLRVGCGGVSRVALGAHPDSVACAETSLDAATCSEAIRAT